MTRPCQLLDSLACLQTNDGGMFVHKHCTFVSYFDCSKIHPFHFIFLPVLPSRSMMNYNRPCPWCSAKQNRQQAGKCQRHEAQMVPYTQFGQTWSCHIRFFVSSSQSCTSNRTYNSFHNPHDGVLGLKYTRLLYREQPNSKFCTLKYSLNSRN